jgi:DNA-binding LytR/AlgR family response regulator
MAHIQTTTSTEDKDDEFISVKTDEGRTVMVARSRVSWAEAEHGYLRVHTETGESYLYKETLKNLEQRWNKHGFVQIHKSYLVFLPRVREVRLGIWGHVVLLGYGPGAAELPVGRKRVPKIKQLVKSKTEL